MKLAVSPEDLSAAASALAGCSARLDEARAVFARSAAAHVPELGQQAVAAAGQSAARAESAVATIAQDLDELARALRMLAHLYAELDRGMVHR